MEEKGPKRRPTHPGLGGSGLRARADDAPPSSRAETQTERIGQRFENSTPGALEAARPAPHPQPSGAVAGAARESSRGQPVVIDREERPSEMPRRDPQGDRASRVDTVRLRDDPPPRSAPSRSAPPRSAPPQDRKARPALRVDDVGATAVRMAARMAQDATPKVLVDRRALASAPIDHREAFLVSLVDGALTVGGLVDVSGMPEGEVHEALRRLARLGILAT
jgi:hypothetical protein